MCFAPNVNNQRKTTWNCFYSESISVFGFIVLKHEYVSLPFSWEDKHFFSFILDKVLAKNNKRNQLKIKGM